MRKADTIISEYRKYESGTIRSLSQTGSSPYIWITNILFCKVTECHPHIRYT